MGWTSNVNVKREPDPMKCAQCVLDVVRLVSRDQIVTLLCWPVLACVSANSPRGWLLSHLVTYPLILAIINDLLPQYCEFALKIQLRVLLVPSYDNLATDSKRGGVGSSCLEDGCVATSLDGYDRS